MYIYIAKIYPRYKIIFYNYMLVPDETPWRFIFIFKITLSSISY